MSFPKVLILSLTAMLTGCASISYPLPKCDGAAKRPLNRSMWQWQEERAGVSNRKAETSPAPAVTPLNYADLPSSQAADHPAFAGFDEAGSRRACRAGYPAHSHDEFVIAAFRQGAQRHQIVRHTGIAYAGTVMIIPPGAVHTGEAAERDGGWEYCAFYPEASVLEDIADEWLGPGTGVLDFGKDVIFEDRVMTEHLLNAHRIADMSPDPIERQCVLFDAFGLLILRYGQRTRERRYSPALDTSIGPAIEFLREHFDRPLIVRDIARVVDFSEFHFMRLFRTKTGLTVHAYLTQLRLQRAKDLLQQGTRPADIAVAVGFFDQSHLINRFRAHFGMTPGDFASACR